MITIYGYILGVTVKGKHCNGTENLKTLNNLYTEASKFRITNMVYKAVFAIAHAIHNVVCQEKESLPQCDKKIRLEPKKVSLN